MKSHMVSEDDLNGPARNVEVELDSSDDFSDHGNATFVNEELSLSALSDSKLNDRSVPMMGAAANEETS